jgi:hypothetical protein
MIRTRHVEPARGLSTLAGNDDNDTGTARVDNFGADQ